MLHDYLTLLLVNMAAGLFAAGIYFLRPSEQGRHAWSVAFLVSGLVAFVVGLHMTLNWPLPVPWANIAFGEFTVLYGAAMLGLGVCVWRGWDLTPLACYVLIPSVAAAVVGAALLANNLTKSPPMAAAGYFATAAAGLVMLPAMKARRVAALRYAFSGLLLAAALIWAITGLPSYWLHLLPATK